MKLCPFCYSMNHTTIRECPEIDEEQLALALTNGDDDMTEDDDETMEDEDYERAYGPHALRRRHSNDRER